jgi:hypothetical protein
MQVYVYHAERNRETGDVESQNLVAEVNLPSSITGSWSRDDIADNSDYNPNHVNRIAPLNEGGMGLRSSMMGDLFEIETAFGQSLHEVGMMGFTECVG